MNGSGSEDLQKNLTRRSKIAEEILETESTYVDALSVVYKQVIQPLQNQCSLPNPIIQLQDVIDIFANFQTLYTCHQKLLEAIKERVDNWSALPNIGDVFLEKGSFMKLYTHYVNNFDTSIARLKACKEENKDFRKFVEDFDDGNDAQASAKMRLHLESFLIMPVQRIPRYVLMLRDMEHHTPAGHPDHEPIKTALEKMDQLATHINTAKSVSDSKIKLWTLMETLVNCPMDLTDTPQRIWLKEGDLTQKIFGSAGQKDTEKPIALFLFNDGILFARPKSEFRVGDSDLKFLSWVPLTTASVVLRVDDSAGFPQKTKSTTSLANSESVSKSSSPKLLRIFNKSFKRSKSAANLELPAPAIEPLRKPSEVLEIKSPKGVFYLMSERPTVVQTWQRDIKKYIDASMENILNVSQETDEKNMSARLTFAQALLSFEQEYLDNIILLEKVFMGPLEESYKSKYSVLTQKEYDALFKGFLGEVGVQSMRVNELSQKITNWTEKSKFFDQFNQEWYENYLLHAQRQNNVRAALDLKMIDPTFVAFVRTLELNHRALSGVEVLLSELLEYPLKHLSRCYAILRQILQRTKSDPEEQSVLTSLVNSIKGLFDDAIDQSKKVPDEIRDAKPRPESRAFWVKKPGMSLSPDKSQNRLSMKAQTISPDSRKSRSSPKLLEVFSDSPSSLERKGSPPERKGSSPELLTMPPSPTLLAPSSLGPMPASEKRKSRFNLLGLKI